MNLSELAIKHETDKSPKHHNYTEIYDKYMAPYRESTKAILEIGLLFGSSAKMWLEYFPNAKVYIIEYNQELIDRALNDSQFPNKDRLVIIHGDQNDPSLWKDIPMDSLDWIVDDGSHVPSHQINTLIHGFPHLKPGGIFICEDLHCAFHENFNKADTNIIYDWLFEKIIEQQKIGIMTGNFYLERDKAQQPISWLTRHVYSFHFYKSVVMLERTND
jgi:SAM-dependent methyltransferase